MSSRTSSGITRVALLINGCQSHSVTPARPQGWMRSLIATQARRVTVVGLALSVNLVIQVTNLLHGFDGAPTWVLIAVATIQILAFGVATVVLVLNLRERRTPPRRKL
jgi:hypothetical protein